MDRLRARIQRALHAYAEKFAIVGAGAHVVHVAAVAALAPVADRLGFVLVIDAIEAAIEVVLIISPGNAGHDMDAIAMVAPGGDAVGQFLVNAVNDGHVRAQIIFFTPRRAGLKTGALQSLAGIGGKG